MITKNYLNGVQEREREKNGKVLSSHQREQEVNKEVAYFNDYMFHYQLAFLNLKLWINNRQLILKKYFDALKQWGQYLASLSYRAYMYRIFSWFFYLIVPFNVQHRVPKKTLAPPY